MKIDMGNRFKLQEDTMKLKTDSEINNMNHGDLKEYCKMLKHLYNVERTNNQQNLEVLEGRVSEIQEYLSDFNNDCSNVLLGAIKTTLRKLKMLRRF